MNIKSLWLGVLGIMAGVGLCCGSLQAQDNGPGGPPPDDMGGGPGGQGGPGGPGGFNGNGNGNGGPGGNFDPAQFEKRMLEQTRKSLNVTNDEDWTAIQPLVQKVMEARRAVGRPGFGPGGPGGDRSGTHGSAEQQELQTAVEQSAPVAQIKTILTKYRAVRADKQAKLEAAQADLKNVLSVKQEAEAVLLGLVP